MLNRMKHFLKSRTFLYIIFSLMAAPFVWELFTQSWSHRAYEHFLRETGEWAGRFLVFTLLISPLKLLFKENRFLKWAQRNKRAFGIFTFIFSAIHVTAYIIEHPSISRMIGELSHEPMVLFGWIAFLIFVPLALTSNNFSMRLMKGKNWKNMQRLVYIAAVLVTIHWLWGEHHWNWGPVLVHFLPLLLLEAYRVYRYLNKESRSQLAYG